MTFGSSEAGGVWIAACDHSTGWSYLTSSCSWTPQHGWQHSREMPWSNQMFTSGFTSPLSSLITKKSWSHLGCHVMIWWWHRKGMELEIISSVVFNPLAVQVIMFLLHLPGHVELLSYIHQSSWKAGPEHLDIKTIHKSNGKILCLSFQLWSARWTLTNYFSQISPASSYKQQW